MEQLEKDNLDSKIVQRLLTMEPDITVEDALENEMIINMGPQHPATHGVLRLLLRLDGETVVAGLPELGYLHRGYEKMAEFMNYLEYIPHTDRLDYISPPANNVAFTLAVEKLLGIEAPERAQWIRMIFMELSRIASHLIAVGSFSLDIGALTVFMWGIREREKILNIYDRTCGARFTTSYSRIGGVAGDMDDEAIKMTEEFLDQLEEKVHEMESLLYSNKIFLKRTENVGVLSKELALEAGFTGSNLRASGWDYDIRKYEPYLKYDKVDFKVPVFEEGDCLARYHIRAAEIRESMKIIRQCIDMMPKGEVHYGDPKKTVPGKKKVYTKMEELIDDFMVVNFGVHPPEGDVYHRVENPKGELGFYIVSKGEGRPWKMKIRSPSFQNIQAMRHLIKGYLVGDVVAIIGSIDPIMGEADK